MGNPHRILGIGDNTVDTYVSSRTQYPGGNTVNVAALARRLGARSAYLGCVGDDAGGRLVRDALMAEGVDVTRLRVRPGENARAFVVHDQGDRRFLGSHPGVRAQYRLTDADFDYVAGFDLAHSSVYSGLEAELPRLAAAAQRLSFDYSNRWDEAMLRDTAGLFDAVFLSAAHLHEAACRVLLERCIGHGARCAVATRGAAGALAIDAAGQLHAQGVFPAEAVDTLGAGDGFITAFLLARLDGRPLPDCLEAGARFGARVCGWHGGFGHGRPWEGEGAHHLERAP
ncbi:hypothetical protein B1992_01510 [Pseudoxanthomonas broegbernensis]|uniref:Carbohydrate kinase PfkB domain-containing protein n=1 Tax=Pseudoxanthomonas broegbernensis TaxID=83619 RepID=A0A7V8GQ60_9GAMM|nr:PfkB family carbohydrate kinase [Pseudoxanthomonas broegbernensis]KAF1688121.1 hypothetical protein B1992_01510 [Pseudoxanthomonas broegbernensis]MBB6065168.1 fructoselysine 6-kinase [Pseudoxanthomonas broegbernensis]